MPLIWRGGGGELSSNVRPGTPPPGRPARTKAILPPVPPLVTVTFLLGYLLLGAWLFAAWERRSFLDGLYFTFTALTTIGLSDHIPWNGRTTTASPGGTSSGGSNNKRTSSSSATSSANIIITTTEGQLQILALCIYILFGLVLVATAFSLVQEQVIAKTRQIAVSLGVVKKEELPV